MVGEVPMENKSPVQSKTIVVNLVALAAILGSFGLNLDVEQVAAVAAVVLPIINIALRFITKQPVSLFPESETDV
jgi:putative N-acetylmannosamine-6-phosphate epimerase